jgi:putative Mg2+ transporter-C (MgtC) family protein
MNEIALLTKMLPEIGVATICGALIGLEREIKNKVAGIRTHILICVGVTIFTLVGVSFGKAADPTRVIAQIITGIGFLGGGVIFKEHDKVVGVTSAAFIWFIASIGVLCGLGYLLSAGILTVGFLIITIVLSRFEHVLDQWTKTRLNKDSKNKTE